MKKVWMTITGIALALGLFLVLTPSAMAQGPRWGGGGGGMGRSAYSPIAIAAQELGMTTTDLLTELQGGKSVAQVADEQGVALETIVDAVVAVRAERLDTLVEQGYMTQADADARLDLMRTNITARFQQPWSSTTTPQGSGWGMNPGTPGSCLQP